MNQTKRKSKAVFQAGFTPLEITTGKDGENISRSLWNPTKGVSGWSKAVFLTGFTLLEVLVASGISLVILTILFNWGSDMWRQNTFVQSSLLAESEARSAMKTIIAEIRSATAGNDGSYALALASTTAVTFYSDLDRDGDREKVRYFVENGELKKGVTQFVGSPGSYVPANEKITITVRNLTNATSGVFSFYGDDYDGASSSPALVFPVDPIDVRVAGITIGIDDNPEKPPAPMLFQSRVMIRNIKNGQ